ncbi:hypothetical protein PROFUN_13847 [Planoprotostelium fungivorum]|uniref:Uncharacterized protein n=1 Tax=Planoprotostelium fungivorum TaxID=1890364 RepID=A0A2P6N2R5_9EUKA|nr:hypothetical protein PROFUN_13847 [Planoprotostelium fungivorum]
MEEIIEDYITVEKQWIEQLSREEIETVQYWGEVLFMLSGLKPCVLMTETPHVSLTVHEIASNILTPNFSLKDSLVVVNNRHHLSSEVHRILCLDAVEVTPVEVMRTEEELAKILDYPFPLPSPEELTSNDEMMEVVYFDVSRGKEPIPLSSYGILHCKMAEAIKHFKSYRRDLLPIVDLRMASQRVETS